MFGSPCKRVTILSKSAKSLSIHHVSLRTCGYTVRLVRLSGVCFVLSFDYHYLSGPLTPPSLFHSFILPSCSSRYYFPLVCPSIWARRRNKMTISMCSRPTNSYCAVSESRQDLLLFSVPAHHSRNHERTTRAAVLFPRSYTRFSLQPSESVAGKVIARTITLLFRISPVTACTCPELICSAFTANCRAVSALRRKKLYLFTCLLRRLRHLSGKHR